MFKRFPLSRPILPQQFSARYIAGASAVEKYVLVPNDVAVIPKYVNLRSPSPSNGEGAPRGEAQRSTGQDVARAAAELAGRVTPAAPTVGSVIRHADLTSPHSSGFQGRFHVVAGSTAGGTR